MASVPTREPTWSIVIAIAALLVTACGTAPARTADLSNDADSTMWCVGAITDSGEALVACAFTEETCDRMRGAAEKWGGAADIAWVGERCEWRDLGASP